ncbi:MAG: hypothetical protein E5X76_32000 [Mesorhizobium sp.]|nr:MAG: hypothetical protein E5X76_32000 [Mesorhizobium sp.]
MTTQLIFVESAKLYVLLSNSKIVEIQKSADPHINPHATGVKCLDATTDRTNVHIADRNDWTDVSKLYLDAADITTFAAWLRCQMPNASTKAFGNAVFDHFPNSPFIREVLTAAGRAAGIPGMKRAWGEGEYYVRRAIASDPEGFAALAAANATGAANSQTEASPVKPQ